MSNFLLTYVKTVLAYTEACSIYLKTLNDGTEFKLCKTKYIYRAFHNVLRDYKHL